MQTASTSHKSAICVIPSLRLTQAVQKLRCFRDKSFVRWPPHINLLYPFLEDQGDAFRFAAATATHAICKIAPFKLKLSSLSYFSHGPRSYTMWMKPDDQAGLQAVQAALQSVFPGCDTLSNDPSRGISSFTPHLSLGQWQEKQQMLQDMKLLEAAGLQLEFDVTEVCLISRKGYLHPFTIRYAIPLGTSTGAAAYQHPQLLDIPYIATVGPHSTAAAAHCFQPTEHSSAQHQQQYDRSKFGLGAYPGGVLNFAYGANMNPKKLGGSRALHPLASTPGVLKGYSLKFNHRGGFGNVVASTELTDKTHETCPSAAEVAAGQAATDVAAAAAAATSEGGAAAAAAVSPSAAAGVVSLPAVHGVLHRLAPVEMATLTGMEHEYWPVEVLVEPYARLSWAVPSTGAAESTDTVPAAQSLQVERDVSPVQEQQQQQALEQQQPPVVAVAFVSPPERCIQDGLPASQRYLDLLAEGAKHWNLDESYTAWLAAHDSVAGNERTDKYYTSPDGQPLEAWPKIRTGSQANHRGGRRGSKRQYHQKSPGKQTAASGAVQG